jgi:hypothetical protein
LQRRDCLARTVRAIVGGAAALPTLVATARRLVQATPVPEIPGRGFAPAPARGPLKVHPANSRYFTDGSGQPVFLTGSHTWAGLQEMGLPPLRPFAWSEFLDMLLDHNHNCTKLWIWLQAEGGPRTGDKVQFDPLPYMRRGPGLAMDGKPKFDLTRFNEAFFQRLRSRSIEAGERGIYVCIQLFLPGASEKRGGPCDPWPGHPYNLRNNINAFDGERGGTSTVDLDRPEVRAMQAAYMRKVIDTVNDLDNVLYEAVGEGGRRDWDWWVVEFVHNYEASKGKKHPVGLTGGGAESLQEMLASPADWVGAGWNDGPFKTDPPAWDGRKVSILDTDHIWGHGGTASWAWKSFLRGHNTWLMDPWMPLPGHPCGEVNWMARPGYSSRDLNRRDHWTWEPVRMAMGNARALALRINLMSMVPHDELASTRYCLANPGWEYLIYLPEGDEVTVDLSAVSGDLAVEWMHPVEGTIVRGGSVSGGRKVGFAVPFGGAAILHARKG